MMRWYDLGTRASDDKTASITCASLRRFCAQEAQVPERVVAAHSVMLPSGHAAYGIAVELMAGNPETFGFEQWWAVNRPQAYPAGSLADLEA
jgi:hypothetical protein